VFDMARFNMCDFYTLIVTYIFPVYTRGGQLDEFREPRFMRQVRKEP
jgi:hypothetical protein